MKRQERGAGAWRPGRGRGRWVGRVLPLLLLACSNPLTVLSAGDGDIEVTVEADAFRVKNNSEEYSATHFIVELETSRLVDLSPCEEWPLEVAPGLERVVPHAQVVGYHESADTAVVYWCLIDGMSAVEGGTIWVPFR